MTDFLSNLVARTLETAHVVRPRPVSLFEPWRAADTPLLYDGFPFETVELETIEQEPASDDGSVTAPPVRPESPWTESRPALSPRPLEPPLQTATPKQPEELTAPESTPPLPASTKRQPQSTSPPDQSETDRLTRSLIPPADTRVTVVHHHHQAEESPPSAPEPVASSMVTERHGVPEERRSTETSQETAEPPAAERTKQRIGLEQVGSPPAPRSARDTPKTTVAHHYHHPESEKPASPTLKPMAPPHIVERLIPPEGRRPTEVGSKADADGLPAREAAGERDRLVVERLTERVISERLVSPVAPLPAEEESSSSLPPASLVVQPEVSRYLEPAPLSQPDPQPMPPALAPERTINVTIGRIEVRARPPSPAPKKRRSRPSVMSLDEYLRQRRNGGGG